MEKKDKIFLVDFDKTVTESDTTDTLMEIKNETLLREYQDKFRKKEINIKEYLGDLLGSLEITEDEFKTHIADNVKIDPYFKEFLEKGYDYRIVSAATYLNIDSVLEKNDIKIEKENIYSNILKFNEEKKIEIDFPFDVDNSFEGICKKTIINKYKEEYKTVIFIGDGSSDIPAAEAADLLFAKKGLKLENYCIENNIKYIPFTNFKDIIEYFEK